jgi:hypothetical protein
MSTVILDTITGKSTATTITIGSTPVVSASANSMTIRGEGSAQTSVQGGLAKCFLAFNGEATPPAVRSSLNVSSLTDNSAANYTINIDNDMADANFAWSSGIRDGNTEGRGRFMTPRTSHTLTASAFQIEFQNDNSDTLNEPNIGCVIIHGDLA